MASYPSAPSKYPGTPTKYPTTPAAYPTSSDLSQYPPSAAVVKTPAQSLLGSTYQWIESGLGETVVSGSGGGSYGTLSAVADQSPSAFNYTSSGSSEPTAELAGWNGNLAWTFDGVNDVLNNADTGTGAFAVAMGSGNDKAWTMWMAVQTLSTGSVVIWSMGNSGLTTNFLEFVQNSVGPAWQGAKNDGATKNALSTNGAADTKRHVIKLKYSGTDLRIFKDGTDVTLTAAPNLDTNSVTFNRDAIGCLARNTLSNFGLFRMACRVFLAGTPVGTQEADMDTYMAKFITPATRPMLMIVGDSMSLPGVWDTLLAGLSGTTEVNVATGGETLAGTGGLAKQFTQCTSNFDSNRSANAATMLYGTNDIALLHRTDVQLATDTQTWITNEKTANPGRKIVVGTIFKRGGASPISGADETSRVNFNTNIRANYATWGADYLLDRDLIITELPTDTSVFNADGIHLNATGNGYLVNGRNGQLGLQSLLHSAGVTSV